MTEENRFGRKRRLYFYDVRDFGVSFVFKGRSDVESYIRTVKLLAEEVREEVEKNGADLYEAASQSVENTDWIIYYYGCTKVLEHTNSPDAGDDSLDKLQISEAWGLGGLNSVLQLHAFYSMLEDVLNLYEMQAA